MFAMYHYLYDLNYAHNILLTYFVSYIIRYNYTAMFFSLKYSQFSKLDTISGGVAARPYNATDDTIDGRLSAGNSIGLHKMQIKGLTLIYLRIDFIYGYTEEQWGPEIIVELGESSTEIQRGQLIFNTTDATEGEKDNY